MSICSYTETGIDSGEENWDDWIEDSEAEAMLCLFCDNEFDNVFELFAHCKETHSFDFIGIIHSLDLEFYDRMKLVNRMRKLHAKYKNGIPAELLEIKGSEEFFKDDSYLKPVIENDNIFFELEDLDMAESMADKVSSDVYASSGAANNTAQKEFPDSEKLKIMEKYNQELLNKIKEISGEFEEYRNLAKKQFLDSIEAKASPNLPLAQSIAVAEGASDYYFDSYAYNEIHMEMIKDSVRTDAYRDFIYNNKSFFKGKVVLDVGCGTGILSMFAARAGAAKVFAVDNSNIIEKARENVRENGLENVITLVRGKIEEIALPVTQVDIIISEWMGYFLLFESMLDSVLVARDRYLNSKMGVMGPSSSKIYLTGIQDDYYINNYVNFWDSVYGFSMTPMKSGLKREAVVAHVPRDTQITSQEDLLLIDHYSCTVKDLDFNSPFCLKVTKDTARLHALVGYFDTFFSVNRNAGQSLDSCEASTEEKNITLSTNMNSTATHWKQTMFLLETPLDVKSGDLLVGVFDCRKSSTNPRELDIEISYRLLTETEQLELLDVSSNGNNDLGLSKYTKDYISKEVFTKFPPTSQEFAIK